MKLYTKLLTIPFIFCILVACSPKEPPSETFLDTHKQALDKAKNVEQIGLDHKRDIDNTIDNASSN